MSDTTWQGELETVDRLINAGDVAHALTHLGAALAMAPHEERVHSKVEAIAAKHPLLELLPEDDFIGTALLKGFALRRAGRVDEAVVLVAQLAQQLPARRFESLLVIWLVTARAQGRAVATDALGELTRLLMTIGQSTVGLHRLLPGEREVFTGYEALADVALELNPADESLRFVSSGVFRRLGLAEKALRVVEGLPGYFANVQRGLAQRAGGDFAAALKSFQKAGEFPDSTRSDVLEQVRCLLALRRFAEAGQLLKTVPGEMGVELSGMQFLADKGYDGDVIDMLDSLRRMRRGPVTAPGDATVNIFREHRAQFTPGSTRLQLHLNGWESPSNHLLAALFATGTSDLASVEVSLDGVPSFARDPGAQLRGSPPPTWHRMGNAMTQVTSAPSAALRSELAKAGVPDLVESMWSQAGALAKSLTTTPAELMAAMVHPPTEQPWLETLPEGLYRYQAGVAFVLAQLPLPWSESRPHFESLLFGPVDWTSAVAITALAQKARHDPEASRDAIGLLNEVVNDLLPSPCEPRAFALGPEFEELPGISTEARVKLSAWFEQQFPKQPPKQTAAPAPVSAPVAAAPLEKPGIPSWVWLVGALAIAGALVAFAR
ncbi:MAG: hypothetical protein ACO1OB_03415 [Archangium sp.]